MLQNTTPSGGSEIRLRIILAMVLMIMGQQVHAEPIAVPATGIDPRVESLSHRYRDRMSCEKVKLGKSLLRGFGVGVLGVAVGVGMTRVVDRWNSSQGETYAGMVGFSSGFALGLLALRPETPDCDLMQFSGRDREEIDRFLDRRLELRRCHARRRRTIWLWGLGGGVIGTTAGALVARSLFKDEPLMERLWKGGLVLVLGQGTGGGLGTWIGYRRAPSCADPAP